VSESSDNNDGPQSHLKREAVQLERRIAAHDASLATSRRAQGAVVAALRL
jgi:hypothetical protein